MTFLKTELIFVSKDKIGNLLYGTRCINCHKQDTVLIRVEWLLLCEKCLNKFIEKIENERPST